MDNNLEHKLNTLDPKMYGEKAEKLFTEGYNCAQAVVYAFNDILESDVMKTDKGWSSFDTYFKTVDAIQQGNEYMDGLVTEAMQPKFVVVNDLVEMTDPSKLYLLSDGRQFGIYIYDKTNKKPVKLGDKEVNLALYATKVYANGIKNKTNSK